MVKIVNEVPDQSVVKQCVCGNCGVTLEYTPNDKKEGVATDYAGCRDIYKYIICPKCSQHRVVR